MSVDPRTGVDSRTGSDRDVDAGENLQVVRASARQRRNQRRRRRMTIVTTSLTVIFAVAMSVLVYAGWRSTLRVTGGRDQKVTDPAAPGYTAAVLPTPVELLAVTDGAGHLTTMLMFIAGNEKAPVTIVPVSRVLTAWDYEDAGPMPVGDLFSSGGMDVMTLRLGADLSFGITSFAEVPFAVFEPVLAQIGDLTIELADNVYGLDENGETYVNYGAGTLVLQPSEVQEFLTFSGFMELELNRALRARAVWTQVLDRVVESASSLELPDSAVQGAPLLAKLRGAASTGEGGSPYSIEMLPTKDVPLYTSPPIVLDRVDADSMPAWVTQFVPFPTSAYPGQRWVVSLLNGTTDKNVIRSVAPRIVSAGGAIGLTGNGPSFDLAKSRVEYSTDEAKAAAETAAAQFGITPTKVDLMPSGIDVTVVVGKDLTS
ncbi:MAG: LytR C-terminal domain-containing protein [Microthrixaceae bacterium]